MNDVSNRAVREFSEFLNSLEADFPKPTCTTAYEITMKSTIVSALITLDTEKQMDERFWNHLLFGVQRNQGTDDGAFHRDLVCCGAGRFWKIDFDAVKELRKFPDSPVAHIIHSSLL